MGERISWRILTLSVLIAIGLFAYVWFFVPAKAHADSSSCGADISGVEMIGKDVLSIKVSDTSRYIIDNRFGLCFYETLTVHGASVIKVGCKHFKEAGATK